MYSICSSPFDSNPDWCQLLVLILFAPHPFCAAIFPPSPHIQLSPQMLHLSIPHPLNGFSGISDTLSAEITKCAALREQRHFLCSLFPVPIFHFLCHVLSLSPSTRRPQITTSLRVWSVAGVPRWCWVKVESFMRREISRFSKAPDGLFPANTSQTTLISVLNAGTRYGITVQKQRNVYLVLLTKKYLRLLVFLKSAFLR